MSNALANSARLKPDIRLADAVSQFQADLSSREKAIFTECRDRSVTSTPTVRDVSRVTAEIDRHPSWQSRATGRRCFGPRLMKLLEAVQQFASIGDVVVGGSQNIIACGVWSLVRMTLLVGMTIQVSCAFDSSNTVRCNGVVQSGKTDRVLHDGGRISTALSKHGRPLPPVCSLAVSSERVLHRGGADMPQANKDVENPVWRQIGGSFLSAAEMSGFQSDLDRWATSIKDEVTILTAQSINDQAADLRLVSRNWAEEKRRRELKDYHRLLDLCSTYDYQSSWKELRKIGNTDLFNSLATYRDWKAASHPSSTLVCMGKLGSGKSVWLANMVDDLHLAAWGDKQSFGYFFCRHDVFESLNALTVIGSITRQILQQYAQDAQLHASREYPRLRDLEELVNLLRTVVPPNHVIHLVIDGLDECNDSERDRVLQALVKLQTLRSTHVCLSFRLEADNSIRLNMESIPNCSIASIPEDNPDISYFIEAELQRCLEMQKLTLGNPALIARIRDALLQGSQGMFLWVALQITSLCASRTDEDIQKALENLPRDLPETFSRILQRSRKSGGDDLQLRILGFIITARRPLTTGELREALAVVPGDTDWNPGRLINNIYAALACCGCLITVDEEELTIRLVHHSARTYLTGGSRSSRSPLAPVPVEVASSAMAHAVVTYLNFDVFDMQLSTTVTPRVSGGKVMSKVASSFDSGVVRSVALRILKSGKEADVDVGNLLRETTGKSKRDAAQTYDAAQPYEFYDYAKSYLAEHLIHVSPRHEGVVLLLSKLLAKTENRLAVGSLVRSESHDELLRALIVRGLDVEVGDDIRGATPLIWAVRRGNIPMVAELVRRGANLEAVVKTKRADRFYPPRQFPELDQLLNQGATPLLEAATGGNEEIVKILVDSGANTEATPSPETTWGGTPVIEAAGRGHTRMVKILCEGGANLEARNRFEFTPLILAIHNRNQEMVKTLLDSGADKEVECPGGRTPLYTAISMEEEKMVKLLLDSGTNTESGSENTTPLHLAISLCNRQIVNNLIAGGANTETKNRAGFTPLYKAAWHGHVEMVRLLIWHGAELNSWSNRMTALTIAAHRGHGAVVELLLQAGANPNIREGGVRLRKAKDFAMDEEVREIFTRHGL